MWLQPMELLLGYFAVLVLDVASQRVRYYPPNRIGAPISDPSSDTCDSNSNCVPLRRCSSIRNMPNWREVSIICGSGYGVNRRICCPRSRNTPPRPIFLDLQPPPIVRQTTRAAETTTSAPLDQPQTFDSVPVGNSPDCGLSIQLRQRYVMGGRDAAEGDWPWMVAITMRISSGEYTPWCTGFLIDRRHVLSAAHCFDVTDVDRYQTRIGNIDQTRAEMFPIARIVVPPGYRSGMFYDDLAILTLTRSVNLPNVNPICLPDERVINRILEGEGTTIAGWGSETPGGELSITLKQLDRIPIVSTSNCNSVFSREISSFRTQFPRGIDDTFICAGFPQGARDACGGDSGGPLMLLVGQRWFAIGIVSFGISCGRPNSPGGYTRISSHLNWIRENTRD